MTKEERLEAVRYNARKIGVLWSPDEMVYPFSDLVGGDFVDAVASFQMQHKLTVDGQLGPKTLAEMQQFGIYNPGGEDAKDEGPNEPYVSNNVICDGKSVSVPDAFVAAGFTMKNFKEDGEVHFRVKRQRTRNQVKHFVLHETCGNTVMGCISSLTRSGYGVQLIQGPSGNFTCHGDLIRDRMVHANQLNATSFGCEQVNPYSPLYVTDHRVWSKTIDAQWWTWVPGADSVRKILIRKGLSRVPEKYVTLTDRQVESMKILAPWLCEITGVPFEFPTKGLGKRNPRMSRPGPGVVAHRDVAAHADGRYMLELLIGGRR